MRAIGAPHHVGITVADIERSAAFWERLVGAPTGATERLEGPGLARLVGYPGIRIDRRWVVLGEGVMLELLQYLDRAEAAHDPGTAHPGNVHICLKVSDMAEAHAHALGCGATAVGQGATTLGEGDAAVGERATAAGEGWITVPAGPLAGARIAYLRDPDGVTIELFQPPGAGRLASRHREGGPGGGFLAGGESGGERWP